MSWSTSLVLSLPVARRVTGPAKPLRRIGARYHAPARYDDMLDVHTTLTSVGGASVRFDYRVLRRDGDRLLVSGFTEHAAVDKRGRPRRLPPEVRRRLATGVGRA